MEPVRPEPVRPDVSAADRMKIAAEQLVPLIEELEAELGKEAAHRLVARSVRRRTQDEVRVHLQAHGRSKQVLRAMAEPHAPACEATYLPGDRSRFDFDVTACQYHEHFRALGRPDLGYLLNCQADEWAAELLDDVTFERPSTLMQGGDRCRFRYGFSGT
ncbi:MAG: L-2-amino-thiazoline-4-carboxylic acid hydrolase [Acidimicrobiia bacterium]